MDDDNGLARRQEEQDNEDDDRAESILEKLVRHLTNRQTYTPQPANVTCVHNDIHIVSGRFYVSELCKIVAMFQGVRLSFLVTGTSAENCTITAVIRIPSSFDVKPNLDRYSPDTFKTFPALWKDVLSVVSFQKNRSTNRIEHRMSISNDRSTCTIEFVEGGAIVDFAELLAKDDRVAGIEISAVTFSKEHKKLVSTRPKMTITLTTNACISVCMENQPEPVDSVQQQQTSATSVFGDGSQKRFRGLNFT